ncbi:uncharacterized protein LOC117300417 [Asterias rubens]|uniref:uncharacterized protein LOC117300417 n=1 Tax=Asterias rubens TaxID=7604 RepID=UPI001455899E|nr:uncharacterized protein LOC117300417 [Asterias rubens]
MATSGDGSSSSMNQNGDGATLAEQPKEVPTLEGIQRDTAALFDAQQKIISQLKKLLNDKDTEIRELQAKYMKLFLEKKATDRELQVLRETIETDADGDIPSQVRAEQGRRGNLNDPKAAAAGDEGVRLGGVNPESYQSTKETHSVTEDANEDAGGSATVRAQEDAYSSITDAGSKVMGASKVDVCTPCPPLSFQKDLVTTEMISWLSENISIKEWKPLLRKLGVSDGGIEEIVHNNQNNIREQRYQGFFEWGKTSGSKATVATLISAMDKLSLQHNIRVFREEFGSKRSSGIQDETDAVHQDFSCALHELTSPYLKGKFDELKDSLQRLNNLMEPQCVSLQYSLTPETAREGASVFSALEFSSQRILQKYPGDKTRRLQELQKIIKVCGMGVRAEFKKFVCAGVVGPLDGEKDLRNTRHDILSKVEEMLSVDYEATKSWKDFTLWLKEEHPGVFKPVDTYKMALWEKNKDPRTGAKNIIQVWNTTTQATEGKFYGWLVQNERIDIAKLFE